jgi:glucose-6-phosphate 1-dehydrogenase
MRHMTDSGPKQAEPITLHPTIFVILGITGDLSSRKLLPALLELFTKRMLPQRFMIVGFSRRTFSREEFRELLHEHLHVRPGQYREEDIKHFFDHIIYEQGLFNDHNAYIRLQSRLQSIDDRWGQCSNKIFHLSVPPNLYEGILTHLSNSKLTIPCDDMTGWTRVLIEKPFGNDIYTARSLDKLLGKLFQEKQIFRIDHYLAKEALQNILAFRFANPIFEPIWNRKYIDKVHIKLYQKDGVEERGAFYDPIGALKDVGQNHILAMLGLITMNDPGSFSADAIRRERARALNSLKRTSARNVNQSVVRGQYFSYQSEKGVKPQSTTETYFRIKAGLSGARWKGVPFYLESGKALSETKSEIDIYFKKGKKHGWRKTRNGIDVPNILTFRIQPDEGIKIRFNVKTPGHGFEVESKTLKFKYSDVSSFYDAIPNDYERLIRDAFAGDQTLFASTQEIMASWTFITPIIENLESVPLKIYEKGAKEVE